MTNGTAELKETAAAGLVEFFKRCMSDSWERCDVDGGDIQDWGVKLGLLVEVPYDPLKHGEEGFAEGVDPGEVWFEYSDGVKAIMASNQPLTPRS